MASLDNLRHFVAAVDNLGVIKASEKVFISPSSITRSIQLVEAEAGALLFDRVGRNVRLNRDGRRFYARAKVVLEGWDGLFREKGPGALSGHYRIGASHFLCEQLLAPAAGRLARGFPAASFEVCSLDSHVLARKLHLGELDMGLIVSPKLSDALEGVDILSGQLYLCGGRRHVLAGKPFSAVKARIGALPAIIHRPSDSIERCDAHPMFQKHGIKPKIQMYWDSDRFALGILAANGHWSMLPDLVIDSDPRVVKFAHPKDWYAKYRISLVWNRQKTVAGLKEALLGSLKKRSEWK